MDKLVDRPLIYGRRSVKEALQSDWPIHEVWMATTANDQLKAEISSLAKKRRSALREVPLSDIQKYVSVGNHQGVLAFLTEREFRYADTDAILEQARHRNEKPLVAVLDEITDPHNLGAIIRSAECAGFHGIIVPKHHAADVNATVLKTSAGAAVHIRIAQVTNLVRAMEELKEKGLWLHGSDSEAEKTCFETDLSGSVGLIIGSEGRGMRRLVAEHCDTTVRIPMFGKVNSLNASVAAGILFFEVIRQRLFRA